MSDHPLFQSLANIVENTFGPLSTNVGRTFGDLWYLKFGAISLVAEKRRLEYIQGVQQFGKELEEALATTPEERRIEPNTQIAMNALDDVQPCIEEPELRHMFCKLLTASVDSAKEDIVHPSFSSIIKRMSSSDATLLKKLGTMDTPIASYYLIEKEGEGTYPLNLHVIAVNGQLLKDYATVSSSLNMLQSLGLIELTYDRYLLEPDLYKPFESIKSIDALAPDLPLPTKRPTSIGFQKGVVSFTTFGQRFNLTCVLP